MMSILFCTIFYFLIWSKAFSAGTFPDFPLSLLWLCLPEIEQHCQESDKIDYTACNYKFLFYYDIIHFLSFISYFNVFDMCDNNSCEDCLYLRTYFRILRCRLKIHWAPAGRPIHLKNVRMLRVSLNFYDSIL